MKFTITVTDPRTGKSVSWESTSKASAMNQARIEAKAGADVEVKNELGRIVFKG